jgi:hypothetical protein
VKGQGVIIHQKLKPDHLECSNPSLPEVRPSPELRTRSELPRSITPFPRPANKSGSGKKIKWTERKRRRRQIKTQKTRDIHYRKSPWKTSAAKHESSAGKMSF